MAARAKGEEIRLFILKNVGSHPKDIAAVTAEHFSVTRQSITRHLSILIEDGKIIAAGKTRDRVYTLARQSTVYRFMIAENKDEDLVWRNVVESHFGDCRGSIQNILYYGFTEIYNNVVDHSEGTRVTIEICKTPISVGVGICDDGIGIFEKIKTRFQLADHRQAILELSKGKLTTDPRHHSGQGIFFTSRVFDDFVIMSSQLFFSHDSRDTEDWLIEGGHASEGTFVVMEIFNDSTQTLKELFDRFSSYEEEEFSFSKTHVPLSLATYGNEALISRSQAKRVLARFDRFREVLLNFKDVEFIGQAFADEIFRVFRLSHPEIKIVSIHANPAIEQMIRWVESGYQGQGGEERVLPTPNRQEDESR